MSAILIAFSILLNVLTIFAVIILYLRQNRLIGLEQKQKASQNEIEELLAGFMMEMKEENEELVAKIKELKKEVPPARTAKSSIGLPRMTPEQPLSEGLGDSVGENRNKLNEDKPISASKAQAAKKRAAAAYKTLSAADNSGAEEDMLLSAQTEDLLEISGVKEGLTRAGDAEEIRESIEPANDFKKALKNEMEQHKNSKAVHQSEAEEAVSLFKQGESVENIAKKLNKGKTEVELLLKFYQ
ncbi:hypothetical protein CVD28_16640 [Bacillus sp. M6-12]|uniref:hypothetical protein n=1 Tax=Bacillus sp. M6-12 TaxID=2054166 RepID=UPI000C787AAF|nr:hypothetical protein [Bacillus sp. M6-12]PLS16703.1 hypothetical protein CVD28_16640 [Bacillus sp. M6-12]